MSTSISCREREFLISLSIYATIMDGTLDKAFKDRNHEELRRLLPPVSDLVNRDLRLKRIRISSLGKAVLHCTIEAKDIENLKYLVHELKEHGCDLKAIDLTVLHYAVMETSLDVVKCLINECGLDPSTCDGGGNTALHRAVRGETIEITVLKLLSYY